MRSLLTTESSPHSLQLEKACTQQWRPSAAKNKLKLNKVWLLADSGGGLRGGLALGSCRSVLRHSHLPLNLRSPQSSLLLTWVPSDAGGCRGEQVQGGAVGMPGR